MDSSEIMIRHAGLEEPAPHRSSSRSSLMPPDHAPKPVGSAVRLCKTGVSTAYCGIEQYTYEKREERKSIDKGIDCISEYLNSDILVVCNQLPLLDLQC